MGCVNEALEQQGYLGVKIRQQRRGAEKVMENAFYLTLGGRCVGGETCVHLERYLPPSLTPARTPSPVQPSPQLSHEHFLLLPSLSISACFCCSGASGPAAPALGRPLWTQAVLHASHPCVPRAQHHSLLMPLGLSRSRSKRSPCLYTYGCRYSVDTCLSP